MMYSRRLSIVGPVHGRNNIGLLLPPLLDAESIAARLARGCCVAWLHLHDAETTARAALVVVEVVQGIMNSDITEMSPCALCGFCCKLACSITSASCGERFVDADDVARQLSWVDGSISDIP